MIRVLLVDDHIVVRAGIGRLLETDSKIKIVGEANNGEEAQILSKNLKPDVIIMDISMPGLGGLETIKRIKMKSPSSHFLVFSFHENPLYAERSIAAGALGYVTKANDQEILIEAVKKIASGEHFLSPDIAEEFALNKIIHGDNPLSTLSGREFEIFLMTVGGATTRNIAEKFHLSDKTISNTIGRIKNKLGLRTVADMVHFALQNHLIEI